MKLKSWRTENQFTLRQVADLLGIGDGKNPSRRMQRIETGEAPVDALLADKIVKATDGKVSLQDINDIRRAWLSGETQQEEAVV